MSQAKKLENMLEFMCSDVYEIISSNMDLATRYVNEINMLEDIRELFKVATRNRGELLKPSIEASSFSDVLFIVSQSVLADGEVEDEEMETVAELISDSLHRYCWIKEYRKYAYLSDGNDACSLLAEWLKDGNWLGGNREEGSILRPLTTS